MITRVELSKNAQKDLRKVPQYIAVKLQAWSDDVERRGLEEVRKIPGYHDEPLHGDRVGQRSIRLSRGYRAVYVIRGQGTIEFVRVEEVNKHEYEKEKRCDEISGRANGWAADSWQSYRVDPSG